MLNITNVKRHIVTHSPTDAASTNLKGGIASAAFRCQCGASWHAVASDQKISDGYFALASDSITVNCPGKGCGLTWRVDGDEFNAL
jgi:hypothetical protein